MSGKKVDDYLQEGIYGPRITNPGERKVFLGTIRERVILGLTKRQVMKKQGLQELGPLMKEHSSAKLLLNGDLSYQYYKPFKKLATKHKIPYTTVYNEEAPTDFGIVFTAKEAVDKEDILLEEPTQSDEPKQTKDNKSFFSRLFK
ncbi:YueI family protein [Radiobacillus sp. PE A8.2]|uniref:YueI family protein n=1 Tax=Radiobacillus sp. PE A8.2 TaxID=3380349 RepID=UPI00388FE81E